MPFANLPPVGTQYNPRFNNIKWSQPGGPGTLVFPQQQNGPFTNYPVPGQFFIELSGLFVAGCGHWMNLPRVFNDHDNMLDEDVVAVCCELCTYIQYYAPRSQYYDLSSVSATPITLI